MRILLLFISMLALSACGPSAAETASIQRRADSLATFKSDSIAKREATNRQADSMMNIVANMSADQATIAKLIEDGYSDEAIVGMTHDQVDSVAKDFYCKKAAK
jgi:hypothetical protein